MRRPGDESAILAALDRAFSSVDPDHRPRSLDAWRWAYERSPGGSEVALALAADGRVVAHYAAIRQRMVVDGAARWFSQSVDSFADPTFASGLARARAFLATGELFASTFGGADVERDHVMWGLPVPSAWRIGHHGLGYEIVRTPCTLRREVELESRVAPEAPDVELAELEAPPADLERLCARVAIDERAIWARDARNATWRFVEHPTWRYRFAAARRAGELVGWAVTRPGTFDGADAGLVCDWLVARGDLGAARALLGWLVRVARSNGRRELLALVPDTSSWWLDLQRLGFRARASDLLLVARSYTRSIDDEWLRRHWYFTLADTDLA